MSTMSKIYGDVYLSEDKLNPTILEMRDKLIGGVSKEKVANDYKVPLAYVCSIYKRFSIGQLKEKKNEGIKVIGHVDVEPEPQPKKEEKKEEAKPAEKPKAADNEWKQNGKLTDDGILHVVEMRQNGMRVEEIAEQVGVSTATVYSHCKSFGITGRQKKAKPKPMIKISTTVAEKKKAEAKEESKKTVEPSHKPYGGMLNQQRSNSTKEINLGRPQVKCGLIDGRHDGIPATTWIFEDNPNFNYFQYDKMEKIVNDFIDYYIPFKTVDGKVMCKKDLVVYMTGLPCASATVIKVTNERHVNLTLRHWMSKSNSYKDQVIWDKFGDRGLSEYFPAISKLYMTDCDVSYVKNGWEYYAIKTIDFQKDSQTCIEYIYPELNADVWNKFAELSSKIYSSDGSNRKSVYMYLQTIRDNRETNIKLISKMSNHDFEE